MLRQRRETKVAEAPSSKNAKPDGDAEGKEDQPQTMKSLRTLVEQPGARLRALAHEAFATALTPRSHIFVKTCSASYAQYLKVRREEPNRKIGAPCVQIFYGLLNDFAGFSYKDESP